LVAGLRNKSAECADCPIRNTPTDLRIALTAIRHDVHEEAGSRRLDSLASDVRVRRQPVAAASFVLTIDVEGAEMAALQGMARSLARHSPALVVEVTDQYLRSLGASAEALATFLNGLGYSMYQIGARSLARIDGAGELSRCPSQFNALFTKKPQVGAWTF
jgi:hypothetical protein